MNDKIIAELNINLSLRNLCNSRILYFRPKWFNLFSFLCKVDLWPS